MPPDGHPTLPPAPAGITNGTPLKHVLGEDAVTCLARNIALVHPVFDARRFRRAALDGLESLEILDRGKRLASVLRDHLPKRYVDAVEILLASLTPPLESTDGNGLAVFFYLPHVYFVAQYGVEPTAGDGADPFETSMRAQYELTRRFSAEFSIRPFLIRHPLRTLRTLNGWLGDACPHVRRLCSEGTRPRLPWAMRIPSFVADPSPVLPILESLKDDESLYVRRSVANNLADIAKDHPALAYDTCRRWLQDASPERRWVIRQALRLPARKADAEAVRLRAAAK